MHIMYLFFFEEKAEIQDQHPLSLNRDRDRLQKYWANHFLAFLKSKDLVFRMKSNLFEKFHFSVRNFGNTENICGRAELLLLFAFLLARKDANNESKELVSCILVCALAKQMFTVDITI